MTDLHFDYPTAFDWVNELRYSPDIDHAMMRIITQCEAMLPHPDWANLKRLPYAADAEGRSEFVVEMVREEPPKKPLAGIYFGIYTLTSDSGEDVSDVEFAGVYEDPRYRGLEGLHESDGPEFYWVQDGYLESEVMAEIYRIANRGEGGLGNAAEYMLCLAQAMFLARTNILAARKTDVLPQLPVLVGFTWGDEIDLGVL